MKKVYLPVVSFMVLLPSMLIGSSPEHVASPDWATLYIVFPFSILLWYIKHRYWSSSEVVMLLIWDILPIKYLIEPSFQVARHTSSSTKTNLKVNYQNKYRFM